MLSQITTDKGGNSIVNAFDTKIYAITAMNEDSIRD